MKHGPKPFFGFPFPLPATEGLLDLPLPEELHAGDVSPVRVMDSGAY